MTMTTKEKRLASTEYWNVSACSCYI